MSKVIDGKVESSPTTLSDAADKLYQDPTVTKPEAESAPAEVETPKSETEAKAEVETEGGSEPPEKQEPQESSPKAKARIKELLAEKKRLESELETIRAAQQQPKPETKPQDVATFAELGPPPPKPRKEDFDDWEKYEVAKDDYQEKFAEWKAKQAVLVDRKERDEAAARRQAEQIQRTNQKLWNEREAASKSRHPDFEKIVYSEEGTVDISDMPMNIVINDFIMDSEIGPEIFYHLKKNPTEAERIAELSPLASAKALTKLEDDLLSKINKAPRKTTTLPKPPGDIGGTASTVAKAKTDVEIMYGSDA